MEMADLMFRHRHWDVIEWVVFVNLHHNITWKHMYGDKDSYELAFALADKLKDFSKIPSWSRTALTPLIEVRWKHYVLSLLSVRPHFQGVRLALFQTRT